MPRASRPPCRRRITHAGPNIVEIEADAAPDELTAVNNHAVVTIEGVREKLRVLLVSGEPQPGERTWRNLLKSDANVDLVHFTILRPPEKQDGTPINELSLIAFRRASCSRPRSTSSTSSSSTATPTRASCRSLYFDNIARYVRSGGAVLVAGRSRLRRQHRRSGGTPLGSVLPAEPTGRHRAAVLCHRHRRPPASAIR